MRGNPSQTILLCNKAASGLGGTWVAWLGDQPVGINVNNRVAQREYFRIDGLSVGIVPTVGDGGLAAPIDVTELLAIAPAPLVAWTGSSSAGYTTGLDCHGWNAFNCSTAAGIGNYCWGSVGAVGAKDVSWSSMSAAHCDDSLAHLYCFEK